MLRHFAYKLNEGPFSSEEELLGKWYIGNCRRAVQLYLFEKKKIFLKPEEVLCPESYEKTGIFVTGKDFDFSFNSLIDGDVIYAERIRNKEGRMIDKSPQTFSTNNEYLISLHTALFTGEKGKEIWQATFVEGSSCFWSLEKFLYYYRPICAKRIDQKFLDISRKSH
ncbi:MAG: hypothetical protein WC757_01980 [Candidatus Paceibacterota bacterium]|jgi:hypothetical protein